MCRLSVSVVMTIALCLSFVFICTEVPAADGSREDDWFVRYMPGEDDEEEDDDPDYTHQAPPLTISSEETSWHSSMGELSLRESERKEMPEPDYLLGKVIWGESATFTTARGGAMDVADWNLAPRDAMGFLEQAQSVGQRYHWTNVDLEEFSYDPEKLPVLFFSGVRSLRLNRSHQESLRQYVLDGGMVILDSVYGSPHFTESAMETFMQVFPGKRFRVVPEDHPVLQTYYEIDSLNYPAQPDEDSPYLKAIYVGARIGVLLSPYGIGTGLADDQRVFDQLRERGLDPKYMCPESARELSTNFAGYAVGYADVGRIQGSPETYGDADVRDATDQFVFAQIRHDGAWNVHPGAATALLRQIRHRSAVRVHMQRQTVDLGRDDLSPYPFLYLTGLDKFEFSEPERLALRNYLSQDGFLLANNGLGLSRFHQSVMQELGNLFPGSELKPLSPGHELFHMLYPADEVQYTSTVRRNNPELDTNPLLLGLEHDGEIVVVYSPFDLEAGWLNTSFPLMRGYENQSAQRLGMNIVAYSMVR